MSDSAYGTKVMLGSIDKLICDALQEIAPDESTTVEAYEKAITPTRKAVVALKDALAFVKQIKEKYAHVECPQIGFSNEDYNEMMDAGDNRP
tara:strand:- start:2843 stop:3118 length:276 start_codon:yes stop_codon:yes gene_type:complete